MKTNSINKPFTIKEVPVSRTMFWNGIIAALPNLIQQVAPAVQNLLTNNSNTTTGSRQNQNVITDLIQQLVSLANNSNSVVKSESQPNSAEALSVKKVKSSSFSPQLLENLTPLFEQYLSGESIGAIGDDPELFIKAVAKILNVRGEQSISKSVSNSNQYSKAKVAPLLAALPALAPLLEKILSPEMINAAGDQPVKFLNAISDAALKNSQEFNRHLESINPGVDDPTILPLLASMSLNSNQRFKPKFEIQNQISIEFTQIKVIEIAGKSMCFQSKSASLRLPFKLISGDSESISKIKKVKVFVEIQHAKTKEIFFQKEYRLVDYDFNSEIGIIQIQKDEFTKIPNYELICIHLTVIWPDYEMKKVNGTSKFHYFTFCSNMIFEQIGLNSGQSLSLEDSNQYRDFWHKIWEGTSNTFTRWSVDFQLRYYTKIISSGNPIAKMETKHVILENKKKQSDTSNPRQKLEAKLKTGMEISISDLNKLCKTFNIPSLSNDALMALNSHRFLSEQTKMARTEIEVRGGKSESVSIWTVPELNLFQIHMKKVEQIDEYGQVISTSMHFVEFPLPNSIHVRSIKQNENRPSHEQVVMLMPIEIENVSL